MLRLYRVWLAGLVLAMAAFATQARAADLKYLADDTEVILTINFKQILDSELVKGQKDVIAQIRQQIENNTPGEAEKYLKEVGFDLFRDLVSITVAGPGGKKDDDKGLIIIEGTFQPKKFHSAAAQAAKDHPDHLKINKSGKYSVLEIQAEDKTIYLSMISKSTILASPNKEYFAKALGRAAGTESSKLKKNVKDLLKTVNAKQSISFIATGSAIAKGLEDAPIPGADKIGPALQQIEGVTGAITIGKDIQFQLGVGTKNAEKAKEFEQQANFFLKLGQGVLQIQAQQDKKLQPLVDVVKTFRVTAQDTSLLLRGEFSVENIDKLIKSFVPNN
jgi:hypothetical protein